MKINKNIVIAGIVMIGLGLAGTMVYGEINKAENTYVPVESTVRFIQEQMEERNELIESFKKDIQKYPEGKKSLELIKQEAKDFKQISGISENIDIINEKLVVLGEVDKSIDTLIDAYDNDSNMKKDRELTKKINELIEFNYRIDDIIKRFNTVEKEEFNSAIDKFPVNIIANSKGWKIVNSIEND